MSSKSRVAGTILLAWIAMLGFDFFLHAGLLASLYLQESPFLLPPMEAFRRIPVGYFSFLILAATLFWLMIRLGVQGWRSGAAFGFQIGFLFWGSLALGMYSITTASWQLLSGWFAGQALEMGIAGGVIGHALAGFSLKRMLIVVAIFTVLLIIATIGMQNLGLAPAVGQE